MTAENIKQHLTVIASMHAERLNTSPFKRSRATLQLDHGREYRVTEKTYAGKRQRAKMCYRNAALLAMSDDSLTYVEGYVTTFGIPLEHAFCVDSEGNVVDPTLKPDLEHAYYGVPFRMSFVREELIRRKVWGIIDMNRELLEMSEDDLWLIALAEEAQ